MDITSIFTIAAISLIAAMSPGPAFAIITKNCLTGTFRTGVLTSFGVITGVMVHISYCVFGVAIVIAESPILFYTITYIGAAYLFYLGITLIIEKKTSPEGNKKEIPVEAKKRHHPYISGFLCDILNPKAMLFVMSVFTQFIQPSMTIWQKYMMGSVIAIVGIIWFITLSYIVTHRILRKYFAKVQSYIIKTMGVGLCLLALYVVLKDLAGDF